MKKLVFGLLMLASTSVLADQTPAQEISARSGLPASEVSALLADCDSTQTSMNFCAWRDQIVAERELQEVVDKQVSEHPDRKMSIEARIAKWKKARDASCEKSARKEWGDGSMRPTAQAICATAVTKKMTKKLSAPGARAPT
ncbi:lysozyme inhibitor LprI family protein [Burkholderia alba]|uniref:lysozyme inhibitor LprI family protein n=1 Tax=Burkholderia alba TaxID=2683677 RepID=UPI002B054E3F|nr:lysozyme inhibitor LprI family protein [Burkholderia alba]